MSKSKRCFDVKSAAYYFHMKKNILADFQICISVSLNTLVRLAPYIGVTKKRFLMNVLFKL